MGSPQECPGLKPQPERQEWLLICQGKKKLHEPEGGEYRIQGWGAQPRPLRGKARACLTGLSPRSRAQPCL